MMKFLESKYKTISKYSLYKLDNILIDIYLPIIGSKALNIYNYLYNIATNNNSYNIYNNIHKDILRAYEVSETEFMEIRKKLEAIGLIRTYYDPDNNEYTYHVLPTMTYEDILNNEKLKALLNKILQPEKLRSLKYKYENIVQPKNFQDLTENILYLFSENDEIFNFDFNKLVYDVFKHKQISLKLDINLKNEIDKCFKEYFLSYSEILEIILVSTDNEYLDKEVFDTKIQILLKEKQLQKEYINKKIIRNKALFFSNEEQNNLDEILEQYTTIKTENYLRSLLKINLNNQQINFINSLKSEYELEDYQINIVIDFSLFKNNGVYVEPYVKRICIDLWKNNIIEPVDIINKLKNSIIRPTFKKQEVVIEKNKYNEKIINSNNLEDFANKIFNRARK